jgi:hypothetical protein
MVMLPSKGRYCCAPTSSWDIAVLKWSKDELLCAQIVFALPSAFYLRKNGQYPSVATTNLDWESLFCLSQLIGISCIDLWLIQYQGQTTSRFRKDLHALLWIRFFSLKEIPLLRRSKRDLKKTFFRPHFKITQLTRLVLCCPTPLK